MKNGLLMNKISFLNSSLESDLTKTTTLLLYKLKWREVKD